MSLQVTARARLRVIVIALITITGLGVLLWVRARQVTVEPQSQPPARALREFESLSPPPSGTTAATPPTTSSPQSSPVANDEANSLVTLADNFVGRLKLIIPVAGVRADQLLDTFTAARSEGRVHDAIDFPRLPELQSSPQPMAKS